MSSAQLEFHRFIVDWNWRSQENDSMEKVFKLCLENQVWNGFTQCVQSIVGDDFQFVPATITQAIIFD